MLAPNSRQSPAGYRLRVWCAGAILAPLAHDTVADEVNDLLHKHVERKLHPPSLSVTTQNCRFVITEKCRCPLSAGLVSSVS